MFDICDTILLKVDQWIASFDLVDLVKILLAFKKSLYI